jgi:CRISPR/Cas system-associated exonuclease Cas4 (RecB family)
VEIPNIIATDRPPSAITGSRWHACDRKMWMQFRHIKAPVFKQETLRTFRIGHALEDLLCEWIGHPVHMREAKLLNRWGGTLGLIDGMFQDGEFFLLENKTANDKRWKEMAKKGIDQAYIAQVQLYMHASDQLSAHGNRLNKCLFVVFNKNTSEIFTEVVEYDPVYAQAQYDRIHDVMASEAVPYANNDVHCNWCEYRDFCNGAGEIPLVSCRTCAHVSMVDGQFNCQHGTTACELHLFHPQVMALSGFELVNADQAENTIYYASGMANGLKGSSSNHLRGLADAMLMDEVDIATIKLIFNATELTE